MVSSARPFAVLAVILLSAGAAAAPTQSPSRPDAADERHETLTEMWQRGILTTDMNQWSTDDMELLRRIRKAEASDALGFLRGHFQNGKGLSVKYRPPASRITRLRLTRLGYDRYLRIKSQEALDYFESKEVEAKWAYALTDLQDRTVFDRGSGLLTGAGEELYDRALLNLPAFWKLQTGEVQGNRPVPPAAH